MPWSRLLAFLASALLVAGFMTALSVISPAIAHAGTAPPAPSGWSTVFSDNFAGPAGSAPSSQNWFYDIGPGSDYGTGEIENTTNSTSNVYLDGNGDLDITATDNDGTWTSGRIESARDDFEAPAGGEMEMTASIQQPDPADGLGYWPAFWALGSPMRSGGTWPTSGEIDMMEDVNGLNEASQTLHDAAGSSGSPLTACPTTGCQTGYNTYSVIINRVDTSAEYLQFLMDGTVTDTITEASVGTTAWQEAIDHGFFIIFDLAMGGNYPDGECDCTAPTSATSTTATMSVQYVAVYETGGNSTPTATPTASGQATGLDSLCLSNSGGVNTEGNPMYAASCGDNPGQQWTTYSDGTVRTEGGCLDVVSAGTTSGTDVDWYPCNGTAAQAWTYSDDELVNPNSGLCLTDPGGDTSDRLDIETCADSAEQVWTLPAGSTVTASDYWAASSGVATQATSDTGGGDNVGWLGNGSWIEYGNVDFGSGYPDIEARVASALSGTDVGTISFSIGSATATPFATLSVSGTGGWQTWVTSSVAESSEPTGVQTLYVTFSTSTGEDFVNVNWFSLSAASTVTVTASGYAAASSGVATQATSDTGGGDNVGWIGNGSWLEYTNVDFGSDLTGEVVARYASADSGTDVGTISFSIGSATATPFATLSVSGTGGWQTWVTSAASTTSPVPSGTQTLYVTFSTSTGANFVNVNWFQFS
jgi:hypothetical protein